MELRISEEPIDQLDEHATISMAFKVERILSVAALAPGLGAIRLSEAAVERPWVKDHDAIKGEGPIRRPQRFDTSKWGLIAAHHGPKPGTIYCTPDWTGKGPGQASRTPSTRSPTPVSGSPTCAHHGTICAWSNPRDARDPSLVTSP